MICDCNIVMPLWSRDYNTVYWGGCIGLSPLLRRKFREGVIYDRALANARELIYSRYPSVRKSPLGNLFTIAVSEKIAPIF